MLPISLVWIWMRNPLKPTSHAISLTNAFRDDEKREPIERGLALANAPEKEDGQFVVPKVVG
jgi:aspartyl-tRNA(Asn)/glutamyl-tRNA(Gln) amidotransferase subunit C